MSEASEAARAAMRDKVKRLTTTDPHQRVDGSSWTPSEPMDADVKTGERPLVRRLFKRGGKVSAVEGCAGPKHAGRKPRKAGGSALTPNNLQNRDMREANEQREGEAQIHVGAFKRGGRAAGGNAGDLVPTSRLPSQDAASRLTKAAGLKSGGIPDGTRPTGGRMERKDGGGNWIAGAIKHPGALHKELGVPKGDKIPAKKLAKAADSDNPKLAKRAKMAETLGKLNRASGGRANKKGAMNVNIIIADKQPQGAPPQMPPPGLGAMPKPPIPVSAPPSAGMPQVPPGVMAGMPPGAQPPIMRKQGGRVYAGAEKMTAGSGSGLGRLQKAEMAS